MCKIFTQISILLFLALFFGPLHQAQAYQQEAFDEGPDQIWTYVEARLEKPDSDTLGHFILQQVRKQCGNKYGCLYQTCNSILKKLEFRNEFLIALPISEEMVRLARQQKDTQAETDALNRLIELYNFLEDARMTIVLRGELLKLYEKMGDQAEIIRTKTHILESRAWHLNETDQILPEVEALLDQAVKFNLTETANFLRTRLKYLYEEFGYDDKLAAIVAELEAIPISDPVKPAESRYALHAASGRADLLRKEKKYAQAAYLYQKALDVARLRHRAHFDTWLEVYVLIRLGGLEWERGNTTKAKTYLDTAFSISDKFKMHSHSVKNLKLQAEIAEAESRFQKALELTREMYTYQAKIDSLSSGFDLKKYNLQQAAKQLTAEKESQTLALQLKNSQLRDSFFIAMLVSLLAVGLFIGLWKQRQGKRQLAVQNELIQKQAVQLQNLDKAKSRFFANVSHELRTPLTLMLGPIHSLLKDKKMAEKQLDMLKMVDRNGKQLQQLINEILDLRKLEMGKMKVQTQPTDIGSFFRQHFAQFDFLAEKKQIDFSYRVSIDNDKIASIDREKCRQILYNLLSNAFKFTPCSGVIKGEVSADHQQLRLSITDTGPGISAEDLPHLFDPYFQTNRPDQPAEGGTGIGLALCKEYVELFGGEIVVESTPGKGSSFTLTFPIALTDTDHTARDYRQRNDDGPQITSGNLAPSVLSPDTQLPTSNTRPAILVVEDNPDLQEYIRMILSPKYEVVSAENGQQALDLLHQQMTEPSKPSNNKLQSASNHYQLILSDLMMPVMDGYQLLEQIKENEATRYLPVIMLTARADMQDKLRALRIGVDDYLTKPFDEEELLVRIENLLKNQAERLKENGRGLETNKSDSALSEEDQQWLLDFETYVQENLSNDLLSVPFLSNHFAMSESTLLRQLKRLTGMTPNQYLQEVRLDEARRLLENKVYNSVAQVAIKVGYGDTRSFSRRFKKRFGKLPSQIN